jgi:hypothetical protein
MRLDRPPIGIAACLLLAGAVAASPAAALTPQSAGRAFKPAGTDAPGDAGEQVIVHLRSGRPHRGALDELHILCRGRDDTVDVALPLSWARFLILHVDGDEGEVGFDGRRVSLKLLWETIEELRPGEAIVIGSEDEQLEIWLE